MGRARLLPLLLVGALAAACGADEAPSPDATDAADALADTGAPDAVEADTVDPGDAVGPDADVGPIPDAPDAPDAEDGLSEDAVEDVAGDATPDADGEPRCGDGVLDPGEECDDGEANSDTTPDACRTDCRLPWCGDGVVDSGEACDDGNDDNFDGCTTECALGPVVDRPEPGEILITELMINPDAVPDGVGEWIELHNTTARTLNLGGCVVMDEGTDLFVLTGPAGGFLVEPGAWLVLGVEADPSLNGGVAVDFEYATMLLEDHADEVIIACDGIAIDRVAYSVQSWPLVSGKALSRDPSRLDPAASAEPGAWCAASQPFGAGDHGTPGSPNPACFHLDTEVDACVLTMDAAVPAFTGLPLRATVEVRELGITDLTTGVDVSPLLMVEIAFGAPGTDPADGGWSFAPAGPTPGWVGGPDHWDGYERALLFEDPVEVDVVGRASRDGGATWRWCQRGAPEEAPYDPDRAARVTVSDNPCGPDTCLTPPPGACEADGVRLATFEPVGACVPLGAEAFECVHAEVTVDCGLSGQICEGHACGALAPSPAAWGDVVITELMIEPAAVPRASGQWVELLVPGAVALGLDGCALEMTPLGALEPTESHSPSLPVVIAAGGRRVLGASTAPEANGGAPVHATWGALTLPAAGFELALWCGGEPIDAVGWDPAEWPAPFGASVSLSPYRESADRNDAPGSWCAAEAPFGVGDRGTPGEANTECPGDIVAVESCSLAPLAPAEVLAGATMSLTVRVIERGITGRTTRTDVDPDLMVEVGVGPAGAELAGGTWSWALAAPNLVWIASPALGFDAAEDRYVLERAGPAPGMWEALARVTADGGNSWALCDAVALVGEGEEPTPLAFESVPSACWPDPCGTPPGLVCDEGDDPPRVVVDLGAPSRCELDPDDPDGEAQVICGWTEVVVEDCGFFGATCELGACVGFPVAPAPGDAVFSELMIAPGPSELGEWLEITNPLDHPLDLAGCVLESGPAQSWTFPAHEALATPAEAVIPPAGAMVLARHPDPAAHGGVDPRFIWSGISLGNAADWLRLTCEGAMIDTVAWSVADGWTVPVGAALALSGDQLDAQLNDFPAAWCVAEAPTPGELNPICP